MASRKRGSPFPYTVDMTASRRSTPDNEHSRRCGPVASPRLPRALSVDAPAPHASDDLIRPGRSSPPRPTSPVIAGTAKWRRSSASWRASRPAQRVFRFFNRPSCPRSALLYLVLRRRTSLGLIVNEAMARTADRLVRDRQRRVCFGGRTGTPSSQDSRLAALAALVQDASLAAGWARPAGGYEGGLSRMPRLPAPALAPTGGSGRPGNGLKDGAK